jgi:hypothetical protein
MMNPSPPKIEDFQPPRSLEAGFDYVWTTGQELLIEFQNQGYIFTNQFADSQGQRYQLLTKGKKERAVSSDNVAPRVRVVYPDTWDIKEGATYGARDTLGETTTPQSLQTLNVAPSFSLDDAEPAREESHGEEEEEVEAQA